MFKIATEATLLSVSMLLLPACLSDSVDDSHQFDVLDLQQIIRANEQPGATADQLDFYRISKRGVMDGNVVTQRRPITSYYETSMHDAKKQAADYIKKHWTDEELREVYTATHGRLLVLVVETDSWIRRLDDPSLPGGMMIKRGSRFEVYFDLERGRVMAVTVDSGLPPKE